MSVDRVDWHAHGDFPLDLPLENGGTHIGMFLAWALLNGLGGELHRDDASGALASLKARKITGRQFLVAECDAKLTDASLDEEGGAFADAYYHAPYLQDYADVLAGDLPTLYHVGDTWENYDRLAPVITRAFETWRKERTLTK